MSRVSPVRRVVAAAGAVVLGATIAVAAAAPAAAHGAVSDPPSRIYGCWDRWSGNHSDPAMQTQDPQCWNAWQTEPQAMWNWNGMFKENVGGRHEQAIPDGSLCSADNPLYAAADDPGPWRTTAKPYDFRLTVHDPSNHGADYLQIYVTKQGYDARTEALTWSDLELVTTTGRDTAAPYLADVSVPRDRTGHHVVFTIWQASHLDQPYYQCSDVTFGGSDPVPTTPAPTTPAPTTPAPTTPAPTTPAPTTPAPVTGDCTATVTVGSSWQNGYQATVKVTAGSRALTGWKVTVDGATITQAWNGSASGSTITSAEWNGRLAAGGTAEAGFLGSGSSSGLTATCAAA